MQTVDTLLEAIDNEQLWEVLKKTDKLTLKMLVMRMQGFSGNRRAGVSNQQSYCAASQKIKNFF